MSICLQTWLSGLGLRVKHYLTVKLNNSASLRHGVGVTWYEITWYMAWHNIYIIGSTQFTIKRLKIVPKPFLPENYCNVMSHGVASYHFASPGVSKLHIALSRQVTSCHEACCATIKCCISLMTGSVSWQCHVMSCDVMSRHVTPRHVRYRHVPLRHVMPHLIRLCHVMSHDMTWYIICHVTLRHVMSHHANWITSIQRYSRMSRNVT